MAFNIENTLSIQPLEKNLESRATKKLDNVVDDIVDDRIENAILAEVNNLFTPRVEISGWNAASVAARSERRQQTGVITPSETTYFMNLI